MATLKPGFFLVFALLGTTALSGCEFGNKNVTALTGYDMISGYYASLPQTIAFRAKIGDGAERNQAGTVNQMPAFLKSVMANPTMLYYDDPVGGTGSLRSHADSSLGFPTKIQDKLGAFGVSTGAYADVSGCRFQQEIDHSGTFTQAAYPTVVAGLSVRGNISLDYAIHYFLVGEDADCDGMRAKFKSCYMDNLGCSSDAGSIFFRAFVRQVFDPLVHSGIMTDVEIGSVRSVGYHATYQ